MGGSHSHGVHAHLMRRRDLNGSAKTPVRVTLACLLEFLDTGFTPGALYSQMDSTGKLLHKSERGERGGGLRGGGTVDDPKTDTRLENLDKIVIYFLERLLRFYVVLGLFRDGQYAMECMTENDLAVLLNECIDGNKMTFKQTRAMYMRAFLGGVMSAGLGDVWGGSGGIGGGGSSASSSLVSTQRGEGVSLGDGVSLGRGDGVSDSSIRSGSLSRMRSSGSGGLNDGSGGATGKAMLKRPAVPVSRQRGLVERRPPTGAVMRCPDCGMPVNSMKDPPAGGWAMVLNVKDPHHPPNNSPNSSSKTDTLKIPAFSQSPDPRTVSGSLLGVEARRLLAICAHPVETEESRLRLRQMTPRPGQDVQRDGEYFPPPVWRLDCPSCGCKAVECCGYSTLQRLFRLLQYEAVEHFVDRKQNLEDFFERRLAAEETTSHGINSHPNSKGDPDTPVHSPHEDPPSPSQSSASAVSSSGSASASASASGSIPGFPTSGASGSATSSASASPSSASAAAGASGGGGSGSGGFLISHTVVREQLKQQIEQRLRIAAHFVDEDRLAEALSEGEDIRLYSVPKLQAFLEFFMDQIRESGVWAG